jgi:hypothetical protein
MFLHLQRLLQLTLARDLVFFERNS